MGFQFVQGSLDFPAFVIESSQLDGGSFVVVENCSDEPVDRLSIGNAIQVIVDDADLDPVGLAPPIPFGWVDVAYEPSDNVASRARRMFFLIRQSRSAPVVRARFQSSKPKNCRSAKHSMPRWRLGNTVLANVISPVP
jgi:hypothetical protein